jgi:hypothetical protein
MKHRKYVSIAVSFIVVLAMTSCATTSKVSPVGHGMYTVTSVASPMRGGSGGARGMAFSAADDFCQKMGKTPEVSDSGTDTLNGYGAGSADITFRCVDK